jgi:hypothetical protein
MVYVDRCGDYCFPASECATGSSEQRYATLGISNPDVSAFMKTYREMESVMERYEHEVWEQNLKLKQKE